MCAAAAMPKKAGVVPKTGIERTRKLGTICAQPGRAVRRPVSTCQPARLSPASLRDDANTWPSDVVSRWWTAGGFRLITCVRRRRR